MKNYEKPIVLSNEDIAEGIYAASGAVDSSGAGASGSAASVSKVTLSSSGNEYYKVNTYEVTVKNSGSEDLAGWAASVTVTSGTVTAVTSYNTWLATAEHAGSVITIRPGNGGTIIGAGQEISVTLAVSYSSDAVAVEGV